MRYKYQIFIIACVFVASIVVFVFSPDKEANVSPAGGPSSNKHIKKTSQVNWIGHWQDEDLRENLVREVAREFEFENPIIDVHLRFPKEIGTKSHGLTVKHIVKMIREKKFDWDIIWMDSFIYQKVGNALNDHEWGPKYLVDFNRFPAFLDAHKPFIVNDSTYRDQTGGILVGPYIEGFYLTLWYNEDIAGRLGLTIKEHGMTFDDFLGYIKAVYQYNQSAKTHIAALHDTVDFHGNSMLFQGLVQSQFADFNEAIQAKTSPAKLDAFRIGLEKFEEIGKYQPLGLDHRQIEMYQSRDYPLNDKVLFYVDGSWMYSHWRDLDPVKMQKMIPAEVPMLKTVNHSQGGYIPTWAVFKDAPNRDIAIKLLMYWCRPDVAERWVAYTKTSTGLRGNLEQAELGRDVYERFQATMNKNYQGRIQYINNPSYIFGPDGAMKQTLLEEDLRLLLEGKKDAKEVYRRYTLDDEGQ